MAIGSSSGPPPALAAGSVPAGMNTASSSLQGEVVVEHVPDRIAQLSRTILLTGMISSQDESGHLTLKTQVGELTIRSPIPLPADKILAIQIPPGAPPVRAIISVMTLGVPLPTAGSPQPSQTPTSQPPLLSQLLQATGSSGSNQPVRTAATPQPSITSMAGASPSLPTSTSSAISSSPLSAPAALSAQMALVPLLEGSVVEAQIHALPVPRILTPRAPAKPSDSTRAPSLTELLSGKSPAASTPQASQTGSQPSILDLLAAQLLPTPQTHPLKAEASAPVAQAPTEPHEPSLGKTSAPTSQTPLSTTPSALSALGAKALQTLAAPSLGPMLTTLSGQGALAPPKTQIAQTQELSASQGSSLTTSSQASQTPPSQPAAASQFASAFLVPEAMAEPSFQSVPSLLSLPAGSVATFQVNDIYLPSKEPSAPQAKPTTSPETAASPPPDDSVEALVIGRAPQGQALATSPLGLLVLETKADLPVGTRLGVSLLHLQEPEAALDANTPALPNTPQDWPALQTLAAILPADIRPQMPLARLQSFGANVLFMLAAIRLGGLQSFLNEDLRKAAQNSGAHELLSRLENEVSQASQSWQRPDTTQDPSAWRSLTLPLWADSGASRLAFHIRKEQDPDSPEAERPWGQHFVVEVTLSRLGPLMLDGFILSKRLALTLRSQRQLPQSLQRTLQETLHNSLSASGWNGGLSFETSADIWLGKRQGSKNS